jgi:hypothetical protein
MYASVQATHSRVDSIPHMRTVEEYRQFAELCRQLAANLTDPADKRATELMAAAWDKVANEREAALKGKQPLEPA